MTFRDAETLPVRAKDAVMQIYVAALENSRQKGLSVEDLRYDVETAYKMNDGKVFLGDDIPTILPFLIFRRLGFTQEVLLAALAELETEGAIPNRQGIQDQSDRALQEVRDALCRDKKPTR